MRGAYQVHPAIRSLKFGCQAPKQQTYTLPAMRRLTLTLCLITAASALLSGCDALGIETATQVAEKKEAEGKAIGSACRHAVRSIEVCFKSNPKASKAAVFAGWKEMDAYMRENQIVGMPSTEQDEPAAAEEASGGHDEQDPKADAHQDKATKAATHKS